MGESEEYEAVYRFVQDSRINAIISWILVVFLAASILHHAFTYQPSWALISLLVLSLVVVPPVSKWDLEKMIPWEILLLATLPLMGHALGVNLPASSLFYYISVASTALIITVELHMFTDIKMADWFIVLFIATATLAVSAIWVIIRWFLGPYSAFPIVSHPALMWEFMSATAAGIFFSLLYKLYLRHKKHFKKSD